MSLKEKLDKIKANSAAKFSEQIKAVMQRATKDLRNSGIMGRVLKIGDTSPNFTLRNVEGEEVRAQTLLAQGPLVVSFYRGVW
ncbi:MAG: hypothetical protein ACR2G4_09690 [Pyrinomonadaceae bacterium]